MAYLLAATVCMALSFGLIGSVLADMPAGEAAFIRLLVAALVFLPFARGVEWRKQWRAALAGVVQFGAMHLLFLHAFRYLQGSEAALLTAATPAYVALAACMFGARFRAVHLLCITLAVAGAALAVWQRLPWQDILAGVLLMEGANICFALGQVLWKRRVDDSRCMGSAYAAAALAVLPFCLAGDICMPTPHQWLALLYLGAMPTGLGFWLWNRGASRVGYTQLAVMNNAKIPAAVLFSLLLFGEKVSPLPFTAGCIMVLAAICISAWKCRQNTP